MRALAALCGLLSAQIAVGQTAVGQSEPAANVATSGELEEITVTAQRRSEDLQKSSLAIQVLSGSDLQRAGVVSPLDLTNQVPGMAVGSGGPAPQFYIRGVGDLSAIALNNPAIATNLDGVYLARPSATNANFYDLSRIEVLKGPQGTLYGRNASGGAVNIITNRPIFDDIGGYATLEGGNFGTARVEGAINLPASSTLAFRAAFQLFDRGGYLSDGFDDDKHQAFRLQALWQPDSDLSVLIEGDVAHMGGRGNGFVYKPSPPGTSPWEGITSASSNAALNRAVAAAGLCAPAAAFPPGVASAGDCPALPVAPGVSLPQVALFNPLDSAGERQNNVMGGLHAELNWELPFATLTAAPAYRSTSERYTTYPSYPFYENPSVSHESTLELRLSNNSSGLKWVGGLYFFNEDQRYSSGVAAGLVQNVNYDVSSRTRSYAAFGQIAYSLTDPWRLIAGLRYTQEKRSIDGSTYTLYPAVSTNPSSICLNPAIASCLTETYAGNVDFRNATWKAGSEFDLSAQSMVYFTASTGFKSGGFNQNVAPPPAAPNQAQEYEPEKLLAYELGSRCRFFADSLQVNLEAFYWLYKNHQEPHVLIDGSGNAAFEFSNAGDSRLYGADMDVAFVATRSDKVHFIAEYLEAKYTSFRYSSAFPVDTGCRQTPSGTTFSIDCSGFQLAHAARWSGSLGYQHEIELRNGASLTFDVDSHFASKRWLQIEFVPAELAPSYLTEDLSLTYTSDASRNWTVSAYVRNVTDRAVYTSGNANAFGPATFAASIDAPRTAGMWIRRNF